jgi:hypothetical protein
MQKRNKPNLDRGQIIKENLFTFLPSSGVRWELIVVNMATCDFLFLKIFGLLHFFSKKCSCTIRTGVFFNYGHSAKIRPKKKTLELVI